jgi:hypothetical protein
VAKVSVAGGEVRHSTGRRRRCRGSQGWRRPRRGAEGDGELVSVNGGVEFLLEQRQGGAGEGGGVGEMQTTKLSSIRYTGRSEKWSGGCAR